MKTVIRNNFRKQTAKQMLKRAGKKLNSKKGVSILFGLLAFLIAAMVSAVIVSAALSAIKAVHNAKESTQTQLSMQSAVELICKNIYGTEYSFKNTTVKKSDGSIYSSEDETPTITEGDFSSYMKAAVEHIREYGSYESIGNAEGAFELNSYLESGDLVSNVKVEYVLDREPYSNETTGDGIKQKYNLTFSLTDESGDQSTKVAYCVEYVKTIKISDYEFPDSSGVGSTGKQTITTESYTWTEYKIDKEHIYD